MKVVSLISCLLVLVAVSVLPATAQGMDLIGSCATPGWATGLCMRGNYAYLAADLPGLVVLDISDPTNPMIAGVCNTPGEAYDVFISGQYAYVSDRFCGMQIIDISQPAEPVIVGNFQTEGQVLAVSVIDNRAYAAEFVEGLEIIDVSDPTNPIGLSHLPAFDFTNDIGVIGNYAYLACGAQGLQIVDVEDPDNPAVVDSFVQGIQYARRIFFYGDYIFLADNWNMLVFQISQPGHVIEVASYESPDYILGGDVSDGYVFLADYYSGVQVVDARDINRLQFADSYQTSNPAWDIEVKNNLCLVAISDTFLVLAFNPTGIADHGTMPYEFSLGQNYPNPFNAQTTIGFTLPDNETVTVEIYNVLGQLVDRPIDGQTLPAGRHSFIWQPNVSSGTYFYCLVTDQTFEAKKMVILK